MRVEYNVDENGGWPGGEEAEVNSQDWNTNEHWENNVVLENVYPQNANVEQELDFFKRCMGAEIGDLQRRLEDLEMGDPHPTDATDVEGEALRVAAAACRAEIMGRLEPDAHFWSVCKRPF